MRQFCLWKFAFAPVLGHNQNNFEIQVRHGVMKTKLVLMSLVVTSFFAVPLAGLAGPRDEQWKAVDAAISKGLPQTAITNIEPIIQGALKDHAYAEATKAICRRIALEGNIQGNKPEEKIVRLQAEIARAPKEITPMMETVLANWYWHYFQRNRWRFMQRTATGEKPGDDFTTWDLPRLFAEIERHFQLALSAEKQLKTIPVSDWNDLLEKGTLPDSYRPTLYDFIANEALEFYTSGEQAGAGPEEGFELSDASPALDDAEKFLEWQATFPIKQFPDSPVLKALGLYGRIMRFHQKDAQAGAFIDCDLARLQYAFNTAFGENKSARYRVALTRLMDKWADDPLSAMAAHRLASLIKDEGDFVEARNVALRAQQAHPDLKNPGTALCANLIATIEARSCRMTTERVWNPSKNGAGQPASTRVAGPEEPPVPLLTVQYRNIEVVHFKAIPVPWERFLEKRHPRPENLNTREQREILSMPAALEWSVNLPATPDFKEHTEKVTAPASLKPGFYFIVASHDPKFAEADNEISMTDVWVSDLALVLRQRGAQIEGFVLEAESGEPVSGAEISIWHLDRNANRTAAAPLSTDTNGCFSFTPAQNRGYLFRVRHNGRELASAEDLWSYRDSDEAERPEARTVFFTDRAIYRPGQIIQYKGICLWTDTKKDNYEVLKGESVEVVFQDVNGKEIERRRHKTGDYGSFSGSFTAPRDRLMGMMRIEAQGRASGSAFLRVEEYKRPKFEVVLDAPTNAPRLGEPVSVTGHATAYTGAAVDGGTVKYRVVREVRMPWWWGWFGRGGWSHTPSQEIAHGTVATKTDGSFQIEFVARPDPRVPEKNEPVFTYSVHADVTDSAGETRSDERVVRAGYTALEARMTAKDWQTDDQIVEINLETTTLDGEPQMAEGKVRIYSLKVPSRVQRAPLGTRHQPWRGYGVDRDDGNASDLSDPNNWALDKVVIDRAFATRTNGTGKLQFRLNGGVYRAVLETQDRFGKTVTGRLGLRVLRPSDTRLAVRIPHLLDAPEWSVEPGGEFMALWGTGYEQGRAFVEIEHRNKMVQRYWTKPGQTQQQIRVAVTESMRGGFTLHVTQIRENRAMIKTCPVSVPWSNKALALRWEHFTSRLQPGQKETWTLEVQGPKSGTRTAEKAVAEMVATLYDESLDTFAEPGWPAGLAGFRGNTSSAQPQFLNFTKDFNHAFGNWNQRFHTVELRYRSFPPDLTDNLWGYGYFGQAKGMRMARGGGEVMTMNSLAVMPAVMPAPMAGAATKAEMPLSDSIQAPSEARLSLEKAKSDALAPSGGTATKSPDLSQVAARKNLNETAFFFPHLTSDTNGIVRMTFTMPEALTKWRFLGFAHDRAMRSGLLEGHAVTSKDLMVQPNPPRFLREGDMLEFTVKVSNQSDRPQTGRVRLNFNNALDNRPADALLDVQPVTDAKTASSGKNADGRARGEIGFNIPAKESRTFSWRITVPDGCGFLTYKAVAASETMSDGEEGFLPVLSRRILVTESLPLPVRGPATKTFEFKKLAESGKSKTLQNQSLTVQMVSNPSWYAVMALPYLMEFPHECAEQTFNRLYANALARHIAASDPKIHRIFEQWRNTPALDSPLFKNQDLKSVMIEETPWLRDAQKESEARRNVGVLFDDNRLNAEQVRGLQRLAEMQLNDGRWPWFPGGPANDFISLYIVTGFGRIRHLGLDISVEPAVRALNRLDEWMSENHERILKHYKNPDDYIPSSTDALYLYGRSFFLNDQPAGQQNQKAVRFYLKQSRKLWLQTGNRQTQAHLAIALKRFNASTAFPAPDDSTPMDIVRSLKERSVTDEEMGRFWRDTELSWWWYRAPIETQALMIEALDEIAGDTTAVEDCKVWLLKQKQTQNWKTTKATADAVYALLLRGTSQLASDVLVEVKLGDLDLTPSASTRNPAPASPSDPIRNPQSAIRNSVEPGTGFYEVRFGPSEIKPAFGKITVRKSDAGVAWGGVHWQYLEDMSKVTPYEGTPLKLKKKLFTRVNTAKGPVLESVKDAVRVGDELVVRIELRVDRDMEYVHLKDQRGSGTEPVNVLSRYKYQDGLAYYESTRDTASHFFIDYLPKGTYVFEYATRVALRGRYQTGMAEIQCMYAPEFNSHSESLVLTVK
jgi:uncharacterized protein YfaS (alpha-2-macroglobulin family)